MSQNDEDEFKDSFMQFVKTGNATTKTLLYLIQDLVPFIGITEAQRLADIINETMKGGEEK